MNHEPNQSSKNINSDQIGGRVDNMSPEEGSPQSKYQFNLHLPAPKDPLMEDIKEEQIELQIQKYLEMNILNPDWNFASRHGQASKPGIINEEEQKEECICCLKQINKSPIPLCQNSKELQFLGLGFPLYFIFMKYTLIILLLQILNYSALELYFAIIANEPFCINHVPRANETIHCTSFMILLADISPSLTTVEIILRNSSFVTLLASLVYMRDIFTKTWKYYVERSPSYGTFSVLIEHIPDKQLLKDHQLPMGERIRRFFADKNIFPSQPVVQEVNLIGQLDDMLRLERHKKQKLHELADIRKQIKSLRDKHKHAQNGLDEKVEEQVQKLKLLRKEKKQSIKSIYKEVQSERHRLKRLIMKEDLNTNKAIICFETEEDRRCVLKATVTKQQLSQHFTAHGKNIQLLVCPQPGQINWETISIAESTTKRLRVISQLLFILMLTVLTVAIYFLFAQLVHQVEIAADSTATAIIFCYLVGIIIFNKFILSSIVHKFVDFQKHKTGQSYQFSFMLKYSLGLFFTTAIMTLLVEGAFHTNVYEQKYGIVEEETIMFFFSAFLIPLIWLINPWHIWKLIQRYRFQNTPFITQEEANKVMEDTQYIMGKRYGEVLQSLWFTFLYMNLIPLGSILIFIQVALFYWIDKYNLLRKSSITEYVSARLSLKAMYLLEFVVVLKPAGQLIFDGLVRNSWHWGPIIELIVGVIYLILPIDKILEFFHEQKFKESDMIFQELKQKDPSGYALYNPLSKQEGLKRYFQNIQQSQSNQILLLDRKKSSDQIFNTKSMRGARSIARPHEAGKLRKTRSRRNFEKSQTNPIAPSETENPTQSEY